MDRPPQRTQPPSPGDPADWWAAQPGRVELRPDEVHVWRADIGGHASTGSIAALSDAERARAARFRFDADRERFVASHAALREILASYLDVAPDSLVFGEGTYGKPFLDAPAPGRSHRFSLSHSGEIALVAVSLEREVGVDVERVRPLDDLDGLITRYLSPHERAALSRVPAGDRLRAFFETWTLKEAYFKGCGDGLLRELDAFDVTVGDAQPRLLAVRDRPRDEERWGLRRVRPTEDYVGALAAEGSGWRVRALFETA
ncbi:MAG TPA: 4'-phosphopantetheinyl transferase superfamily protein [Burkholderiales bacterium]|nr:4'-phosphopantetheinyl transferase superfamily protein [Burkholderiales bacterium]